MLLYKSHFKVHMVEIDTVRKLHLLHTVSYNCVYFIVTNFKI